MKSSFAFALLGAFVAAQSAGCSVDASPAPTPEQKPTSSKSSPETVVVPASSETQFAGKAIASWAFAAKEHGVTEVSALGAKNDVVFRAEFQRIDKTVFVTTKPGNEKVRIDPSGHVEHLAVAEGPSRLAAMARLKQDYESFAKTHVVQFDCQSSTNNYYAALVVEAAACLTPEPAEPPACIAATLAAAAAYTAMIADCQPQVCYQNFQCTDAYGPNWVCSGGACVQSTGYIVKCSSDADCSAGFTCDVSSGICYQDTGGGGGSGSCGDWGAWCGSDSDCCNGYCDYWSDSCGS